MGGHAFNSLFTPRISRELYLHVRDEMTKSLNQVFIHVAVPTEMPSKKAYGDVDFLVAGPRYCSSSITFDYKDAISRIKAAFGTTQGRKSFLTERVMYFAIPAPGREDEFWIQIDVKVCDRVEMFEWEKFLLHYRSASKIIGSMIKPLGLTIDPNGLHIRVDGLEKVNLEKSMVLLSKEPKDLLKIVGLDRRILNAGFKENQEVFDYLASSWVFNPAHFAERLKDGGYIKHLLDRNAPYVSFIRAWVSEDYSERSIPSTKTSDIHKWYADMRIAVREKVFAIHPSKALEYYEKRSEYVKEVEEQRLRELIKSVIPLGNDGWAEELPQPQVIIKSSVVAPRTPDLKLIILAEQVVLDTPITFSSKTAFSSPPDMMIAGAGGLTKLSTRSTSPTYSSSSVFNLAEPMSTPLYLEAPPRAPPHPFVPRPPPGDMSLTSKLECLYRWTLFDTSTGMPCLAREPREKNFVMNWAGSGVEDAVLVDWAKKMWWAIWTRQVRVNYVGMWKKRQQKEDAKAEKTKTENLAKEKAEEEERKRVEEGNARMQKLMDRLEKINEGMEMVEDRTAE